MPVTLQNLAGFGWERPLLGVSMWVFLLGMLGFPLTGGFVAKFYVFAAAYDRGFWWLIVAGVIATMISAYYYLGIVRAMYFRDAAELQLAPAGGSPPRELLLGAGVAICVVVTVGSFFAVQPLIDVARSAARARSACCRGLPLYGFAGCRASRRRYGAPASTAFSPNTTRQATRADAPSVGSVCVSAAGERAAHESTRNASARPQRSDWKPASEPERCSRYSPKQMSASDCGDRDGREQRVERQAVAPHGHRPLPHKPRGEPEALDVPRAPSFALEPDGPSMLIPSRTRRKGTNRWQR